MRGGPLVIIKQQLTVRDPLLTIAAGFLVILETSLSLKDQSILYMSNYNYSRGIDL